MSITPPHPRQSPPRMFSINDYQRGYVLFDDVECNIPRWGSGWDYGAWNCARGLLVELSRALRATPLALHYHELLTWAPREDPDTVPAHLPVGTETIAVLRERTGELVTVLSHRETSPYGEHGDTWRLTVNGIEPADGVDRHPPSLPWLATLVRRHLDEHRQTARGHGIRVSL